MTILSKACKLDNFESHNSLKLSFTNIRGLRSNFVECESFLESNFPDILGLCETNLDDSIDSNSDSLSSVNPKGFYYSYAWCCSLGEGRTSFCTGLISRKFYGFLLKFSTSPNIFIVLLFFLQQSASSTSCKVFDSISSNIDQVFSINPSANAFFFGDFNVHHKDWRTYSGGTDRPGEVSYNFSISNDLTQIFNFPTRIPDCDFHSPALLDLFLSYWEILIMLLSQFPLTFHQTQNGITRFIVQLMTIILVLIGMVFVII